MQDLHALRLHFTLDRCGAGVRAGKGGGGARAEEDCRAAVGAAQRSSCSAMRLLGISHTARHACMHQCAPIWRRPPARRYGVDNDTAGEIRSVDFRQVVKDLQVCAVLPLHPHGERRLSLASWQLAAGSSQPAMCAQLPL